MSSAVTTLGIGIVGLGWGVKVQVPAFKQAGLNVIGLCGRRQEAVDELLKTHNIPFGTTKYEELLAREDIHLISIVTPTSEHAPMAIAALRAGKHVLCEKPFTLELKQAYEIQHVWEEEKKNAQAAGRPTPLFIIDHEMRTLPAFLKIRNLIADSSFGKILHVDATFMGAVLAAPTFNWWAQRSMGGGLLGALGSHLIDTVAFFTHAKTTHVAAHLHTLHKQKPDTEGVMHDVTSDDYAQLQLIMSHDNHTFPVSMTMSGLTSGYTHKKITIVTTKGTIVWDMNTLKTEIWKMVDGKAEHQILNADAVPESATFPPAPLRANPFAVGTCFLAQHLRDYLTPLINGQAPSNEFLSLAAGLDAGIHVQAVIDTAHVSSEQQDGKSVALLK